jgi:protein-disulfide isomerase
MSDDAPQKKSYATFILGGLLVIAAFFIGTLWTKVQTLEQGGGAVAGDTARVPEQLPAQPAGAAQPAVPQRPEADVSLLPEVTADDYLKGDANAAIMLIEYSDYECPFCGRFHPTAQQIMDEYSGQVAWGISTFSVILSPTSTKAC